MECSSGRGGSQHKRLYRMGNVLKTERAERLEDKIKLPAHMLTYGPRNADAARRALNLESRCDVHGIPVQISPVSNCVAKINPHPKADGPISGLVTVVDRHVLLDLNGAPHGTIDAVEHDQQGIATSLHDPTAMLLDCRIDQIPAQSTQPLEGSGVIQPDQAAVACHVRIDHSDQLPPIW
jgi:hypothetical protein